MKKQNYKYVYGPVPSWRLGSSLGIDPLSQKEKICTFNCVYCQLGRTRKFTKERRIYAGILDILREIKTLPPVKIDYITFSGRGEPTLAMNLGLMIKAVKEIRKEKIAVITNASLLSRNDVRQDLACADLVVAKLDIYSQKSLEAVNKPMPGIEFSDIIDSLKKFRKEYKGKFAIQVMFIDENRDDAAGIARMAKEIKPDEIQINTPLRPCSVKPLSKEEIGKISVYFNGMNTVSAYNMKRKRVIPISKKETLLRRGKI